jgi:hypothetical protein
VRQLDLLLAGCTVLLYGSHVIDHAGTSSRSRCEVGHLRVSEGFKLVLGGLSQSREQGSCFLFERGLVGREGRAMKISLIKAYV